MIVKNYLTNVSWKFLIKIESTWRHEFKEQVPQLTLLYRGRTVRNSCRRCCMGKLFLKILQYPQETPALESIFKKIADLWTCNFIKKRPQHRCFPVNIAKTLILPILKNISKRLLFNFLMVHSYMDPKVYGLDCIIASGFRIRVSGLVFVSGVSRPKTSPNQKLENLC